MPLEFRAVPEPSDDLLAQISVLAPENPFYTSAYLNSVRSNSLVPYALLLESQGVVVSACTAFLKSGRLNRRLEITSLSALPDGSEFWDGLVEFCKALGISILNVETFGTMAAVIPHLDCETYRSARYEFHLDLAGNLWNGLNRRNRRSLKKAMEAGLQLHRAAGREACKIHADISNSSLSRRRRRGEEIADEIKSADALAFLENGAGEIYQASRDDEVLSSILVLRSATGAYAQTSGTRDAGLVYGAAQFLWYETAKVLQSEEITILNMGGTHKDSLGLQEFKASFGARRLELESAEFYLGGTIKKAIGSLIQRLRP